MEDLMFRVHLVFSQHFVREINVSFPVASVCRSASGPSSDGGFVVKLSTQVSYNLSIF